MASAVMYATRTVSGNQPAIRRIAEKAGETFKNGVPVMMDLGVGGMKEWDGATIAFGIAGVAKEAAKNLTVTGTAQQQSFGSVPNQPNAVNLSRPFFDPDGASDVEIAVDDTIFFGQVGPAQTTAATDIGQQYGMTKDADGHWYVDKTKVGAAAVCVVVKLDEYDTARGVYFKFLSGSQQQIV